MAHEEYAAVHAIYGKALRASPDELRGPPPYRHYIDGPVPKLSANDQARVVLWCAEYVRPLVDSTTLEEFDRILALARQRLAGDTVKELGQIASVRKKPSGPLPIAQLVASALCARPDNVLMSAGAAVRRSAALLGPPGLPAFLHALDREVIRVECQVSVTKYGGDPPPRVDRVLWRADRGNGTAGHFLCTIDGSDDIGLVTKMKNRWRWFRGPLDEMLATLPDALFESAVAARDAMLRAT